ncbi:SGNH/GDSL hydrolase family protein [Haloechinothrix sp. YIM 98757]|uniref:SGNH/GDSL hydrolase family protein n=1 Tax=Haloechinothrix aidingensis TaxID=2752311 RepID=A0A838AF12_9PSEU|nr:SGNH/GDSL hydrolase family protein [Haloechinothrix aidingensis]
MHSFNSYIAIGDSFTEGLNDQLPDGSFLGWADRLAAMLAEDKPDFKYANIAVRGKRLDVIIETQLPVALELRPDFVTVCAGGNDILLPGVDVDDVAARFDDMIGRLRAAGIDVLLFAGPDTKQMSVMNRLRGKIAIYNADIRAIAERHGASVVDLWAMDVLRDPRAWSEDRLHFTAEAHRRIALRTAETLGIPTEEDWRKPLGNADEEREAEKNNWISQRRSDIEWTRAHVLPWIGRRIRRESLGDGVLPKRPELTPVEPDERIRTVSPNGHAGAPATEDTGTGGDPVDARSGD